MILVCGEALIDLFVEAPALSASAELPARAIAGGSPFNVAVGIARLGVPSGYFGGIGADPFGEFLLGRLRHEGVDPSWVKRSAAPTPLVVVAPRSDGQPSYTLPTWPCADRDIEAADIPGALSDGVAAIVFGSWPLAIEPASSALLSLAEREAGRRVISLDPNLRPAMIGSMPAWRARFQRFADVATIIKLSREDMQAAWGDADADGLAAAWLHKGVALVVVTDGGDGATAYHAAGKLHVAARRVMVVDSVGAGDAFHAALLARLHENGRLTRQGVAGLDAGEIRALLDYAVLAASITCSRRGADLPTRADVRAASLSPAGA